MKNLKGTNWLSLSSINGSIEAKNNIEQMFSIPMNQIASSSVINKNDLQVEFTYDDGHKENDNLCEIRFYFPPQQVFYLSKKDQDISEDGEKNEAEKFKDLITHQTDQNERTGESVVTFEEIPLLVPRGKYTLDFYETFLRFHGQTHNYRIEYQNVERAFLLPKPDDVHMFLILSLVKPIRQGNTVYPYITIQIKKDIQDQYSLRIKDEQRSKFNENLQDHYSGPVYDVLTKLLKLIVQTNIIIPANFKSYNLQIRHHSQSGVRCSVKAQEGYLFPLSKSMIFVPKPVIYIRFDDIAKAVFQRVGLGAKLFDVELKRKNGTQSLIFTSIEKNELNALKDYFSSKNIIIEMEDEQKNIQKQFEEIDSDIDVSDDSREKQNDKMETEEDNDESDDESFKASGSEDSASGESDIDDEEL